MVRVGRLLLPEILCQPYPLERNRWFRTDIRSYSASAITPSVAVWSRFNGRAYVLGYREVTFATWADGRCPRRAVWL